LVTTLLGTPANTRTFEAIDGLLTVTSLFKSKSTAKSVKTKVLEFLYFYLMDESPSRTCSSSSTTTTPTGTNTPATAIRVSAGAGGAKAALQEVFEKGRHGSNGKSTVSSDETLVHDEDDGKTRLTRTTEEKQRILGRYLSNVEDLVEDLRESVPFGVAGGSVGVRA